MTDAQATLAAAARTALQIGAAQKVCYTVERKRECAGVREGSPATCCNALLDGIHKIEIEAGAMQSAAAQRLSAAGLAGACQLPLRVAVKKRRPCTTHSIPLPRTPHEPQVLQYTCS